MSRVAIPLADAADIACIIVASLCELGGCMETIIGMKNGVCGKLAEGILVSRLMAS